MIDKHTYQETFSHLRASDDTVSEVLRMAHENKHKKTGHIRNFARTALIAAVCAALLTVTAYAVGEHMGFFDSVFGNSGTASTKAHEVRADPDKPDSGTVTVPAYERVPVDQEKAEELVGPNVVDIRRSFEMAGVTFTAESVVADENGVGALTFTMSCPDGFPRMEGDEGELFNMLEIDDSLGWISASPYLRLADRELSFINCHIYLDSAASTDTEKRLTAYFYAPTGLKAGDTVEMVMTEYLYNGREHTVTEPNGDEHIQKDVDISEQFISFQVGETVPAVTLTATDGQTASVSPMGVVLSDWYDGSSNALTLTFADGSVYTVQGQAVDNTQLVTLVAPGDFGAEGIEHQEDSDGDGEADTIRTEYRRDDPAYEGMWRTAYVFNRLVEPEALQSVHVSGGIDYVGEPQPERTFTR